MANFTALKTAINNAIKTNGNEEITGAVLQVILDAMVETLGDSAINDLENALAAEVTNRENAVGGVAEDLTAEALARANKDNQLDGRINQEEYNRQNADAALSRTVDQGFQTLNSQMTALNAAISALNAAYQNGYLYGGIATPSSSPSNNKCFYIALQGGTYTNFGGVGVVQGINILKNDNGWKVEHIYDQTTLLNEFYLLRQQVIQAITSFSPIVIEGDVTNAPDEEDLTSNAQHLLQFKNNTYSPLEFSGLGRKYLRKNIAPLSESAAFNGFVEGVTAEETLSGTPEYIFWDRMNTRFLGIKDGVYYADWSNSGNYVPASTSLVYMYQGTPYRWDGSDFSVDETEVPNLVNCLTQDMINEANTIYIIRYDYTLKEDITIPSGCVLQFDGGRINIDSYNIAFNTPIIETARFSCFNPTTDDSKLLEALANIYTSVIIDRDIVINSSVDINKNEKCEIIGDGKSVIKFTNNNEKTPIVFSKSESLRLHNLIIDFEQLQHPKPIEGGDTDSTIYFRIKDANTFVELSNIEVKNYWKHSEEGEKDSFYIFWVDHLSNVVNIHDCRFTDIYCVSNDTQDISNNAGVARCLEIYGSKMDYETEKPDVISSGSITINNMYFERCYGVTVNGTAVIDDFDCIQVLLEPFRSGYPLDENSPQIGISVTISNCEFHTCSKRAIKLQASNGLISNILYENSEGATDRLKVPLNTVIQSFGSNNKLEKIFIHLYDISVGYAISLAGTNSILSDSVIGRKYYRTVYNTYGVLAYVGTTIERCLIQNFTRPIVGRKTDDYVYGIDFRLLDLTITVRDCLFPKLSSTSSNTQDCIYWDLTPDAPAGDTTKYCFYKFYNCSFINHIFYVSVSAEFNSCNFTVDEVVQSQNYMIETYNYDSTRRIGLTITNSRLTVSDDSSITLIIFNRINDIIVRDLLYKVTGTVQYETIAGIDFLADNGSGYANILIENVLSMEDSYTLGVIISTNNPGSSSSLPHKYIIKECKAYVIFSALKAIVGDLFVQDCNGKVQLNVSCPNFILDIPNLADITLAEHAQNSLRIGSYKFDSGLPKWWNGTAWVDATGATV